MLFHICLRKETDLKRFSTFTRRFVENVTGGGNEKILLVVCVASANIQ